jgi:hypothetical protein
MTGDSATDYVVGAPGVVWGGGARYNKGAVMLVDGSTHTVVWTILATTTLAWAARSCRSATRTATAWSTSASNAPSTISTTASYVHVIDGYSWGLTPTLQTSWHFSITVNNSSDYGATVASGFDLDHDGRFDLASLAPVARGIGAVNVWRADVRGTRSASTWATPQPPSRRARRSMGPGTSMATASSTSLSARRSEL